VEERLHWDCEFGLAELGAEAEVVADSIVAVALCMSRKTSAFQ
jgi:hypothetical protein